MESWVNETEILSPLDHNCSSSYENRTFCGEKYDNFWSTYLPDELLMTICMVCGAIGIPGNLLSILTFSRKTMRSSTNLILLAIAISDFIFMLIFIPYYVTRREYFRKDQPILEVITFVIHLYATRLFHSMCIFLTVVLSIWRFIAVVYPFRSRSLCTNRRAKTVIISIFLICFCGCLPTVAELTIRRNTHVNLPPTRGVYLELCNPSWCAEASDFIKYSPYGHILQMYVSTVPGLTCILSCAFLLAVTSYLIWSLKKGSSFSTPRSSTTESKGSKKSTTGAGGRLEGGMSQRRNSTVADQSERRVTRMLVVILVQFLLSEGPLGALFLTMALLPTQFSLECIQPLGFVILFFAQLSGVFNFFVYFTMSGNFRRTLLKNVLGLNKENIGGSEGTSGKVTEEEIVKMERK